MQKWLLFSSQDIGFTAFWDLLTGTRVALAATKEMEAELCVFSQALPPYVKTWI